MHCTKPLKLLGNTVGDQYHVTPNWHQWDLNLVSPEINQRNKGSGHLRPLNLPDLPMYLLYVHVVVFHLILTSSQI